MIRILTAAAMAALFATPALAQTSPGSPSTEQPSQLQDQGTSGTGSLGSGSGSTGLEPTPEAQSGQVPSDCLPNDPRPECQTAQLPSDQSPGSGSMSTSPYGQPGSAPETQREPGTSGSWGGPGGASPPSGSPETTR